MSTNLAPNSSPTMRGQWNKEKSGCTELVICSDAGPHVILTVSPSKEIFAIRIALWSGWTDGHLGVVL